MDFVLVSYCVGKTDLYVDSSLREKFTQRTDHDLGHLSADPDLPS